MAKTTQKALSRDIDACNQEIKNAQKNRNFIVEHAKSSTSFSMLASGFMIAGAFIASTVITPLAIAGAAIILISGTHFISKIIKANKKFDDFRHQKILENNFRYDLKEKRKRAIDEIKIYKMARHDYHSYPSPKYERDLNLSKSHAIHHITEFRRARNNYLEQEKQRG